MCRKSYDSTRPAASKCSDGRTLDLSESLTTTNSASAGYGLGVGLVWWAVGIALVAGYFTHLFRSVRGKVRPDPGHGPDASAPSLPNP
jgi:hypothetical protein